MQLMLFMRFITRVWIIITGSLSMTSDFFGVRRLSQREKTQQGGFLFSIDCPESYGEMIRATEFDSLLRVKGNREKLRSWQSLMVLCQHIHIEMQSIDLSGVAWIDSSAPDYTYLSFTLHQVARLRLFFTSIWAHWHQTILDCQVSGFLQPPKEKENFGKELG